MRGKYWFAHDAYGEPVAVLKPQRLVCDDGDGADKQCAERHENQESRTTRNLFLIHLTDSKGQDLGVHAGSPLTLLREYRAALRSLLQGESVTTDGDYVRLDEIRLTYSPDVVPPLFIGAVRPKSLALAGELGDGVLLGGGDESPDDLRESVRIAVAARQARGIDTPFDVTVTVMVTPDASAEDIEEKVRAYVDAGTTRVPICGVDDGGTTPDGSDRIFRLVDTVAQLRPRFGVSA